MIESGMKRRGMVVAALAASLFPIVYLHVVSVGQVSPISHTISDYVHVEGGAELLGATALTLAAASTAMLLRLRDVHRSAAWLMGLWAAGLAVATIFPTDPIGEPTSMSGLVHRYTGLVMYVSLSVAGLLISRHYPTLKQIAIINGGAGLAFLFSHVPISYELRGLAERVFFVSIYGLLFALAGLSRTHLRRTS